MRITWQTSSPDGVQSTHVADGDHITSHHVQDCTPTLEYTALLRQHGDGYTKDRNRRHVASIPTFLYQMLWREGIAQDDKALRKWLMNPDYSFLRVSGGKL